MTRRLRRSLIGPRSLWALAAIGIGACGGVEGGPLFSDADGGDANAVGDVVVDASAGDAGGMDSTVKGPGDAARDATEGSVSSSCVGLQCQASTDKCTAKGLPATTISGVVYDPAGVLPLYGVYVYIPNAPIAPISPGNPTCTQCEAPASGSPVIGALTDAKGAFTLAAGPGDLWGVPSGKNLPLVMQIGKWRRTFTIPMVAPCAATSIPDPPTASQKLRLPAKTSEGDMPLIAFTSGCDPAECFLRRIGIDDSEFVPPGSTSGHVHFYTGMSGSQIDGGNTAADTYTWWSTEANLLKYDIVVNACECAENDRGAPAYPAMHAYLSAGGRLFATHYYFNWFTPPDGMGGYVSDFNTVVDWTPNGAAGTDPSFFVDTTFPKGKALADWAQSNGTTTTYGEVGLVDTRNDMGTSNPPSSRWVYNANAATDPAYFEMLMSFDTPVGAPAPQQCGRVVFSDIHLAGTSDTTTFPNECVGADPTGMYAANEKALEFLFFDLSSCVTPDSQPPTFPDGGP